MISAIGTVYPNLPKINQIIRMCLHHSITKSKSTSHKEVLLYFMNEFIAFLYSQLLQQTNIPPRQLDLCLQSLIHNHSIYSFITYVLKIINIIQIVQRSVTLSMPTTCRSSLLPWIIKSSHPAVSLYLRKRTNLFRRIRISGRKLPISASITQAFLWYLLILVFIQIESGSDVL